MFIDSRLDISPQTEGSSCSTFELNKTPLVTNDDRPFHPPQNFVFPKKQQGKQKRSCQAKWFVNFPWLHYNQQNDSVLCFNCMKQDQQGNLRAATKKEMAFISSGFLYGKMLWNVFGIMNRPNVTKSVPPMKFLYQSVEMFRKW